MLTLQRLAEKGFAFLTLLLIAGLMGVLMYLLFGTPISELTQGNPLEQAFYSGIYLVAFILLLSRYKHVLQVARRNKFAWLLVGLLVGLALISVLWSDAQGATLRRGIALVGTTLFGVYLATRYTLREQLQLLAWVLGIMALGSLFYTLLVPSGVGISTDPEGSWRGFLVTSKSSARVWCWPP